jgi:hypothetical protein
MNGAHTGLRRDLRSRWVIFCVLVLGLIWAVPSAGGGDRKQGGFSKEEIRSIVPLLKHHGMVGLAQTNGDGSPRTMALAIKIKAPRETVFKVFENPENFYYISRLFKENKVIEKHGNTVSYAWASRHKWLSVVGENTITVFPPRRIDASIDKSSIGAGLFKMYLYKDGEKGTILTLSGLVDVQSSEWLIRFLVGGNPSMRQAMNVAIGIVVVKGVKAMAERMTVGRPFEKHRTRGTRKGPLKPLTKGDLSALKPLLERGTVILTDSVSRGRLAQATIVKKIQAPAAKFLLAAATPEFYPKIIKSISDIEIHKRNDKETEFSWTLGFSIFSLSSRNRLSFTGDGVIIEGLEGDLGGALWRWQIAEQGENSCTVAYHGWVNMLKAGNILAKTIKVEPYMEHGMVAGSNMVMMRAMERVVEAE